MSGTSTCPAPWLYPTSLGDKATQFRRIFIINNLDFIDTEGTHLAYWCISRPACSCWPGSTRFSNHLLSTPYLSNLPRQVGEGLCLKGNILRLYLTGRIDHAFAGFLLRQRGYSLSIEKTDSISDYLITEMPLTVLTLPCMGAQSTLNIDQPTLSQELVALLS